MTTGIPIPALLNEIKTDVVGWIQDAIASANVNGIVVNSVSTIHTTETVYQVAVIDGQSIRPTSVITDTITIGTDLAQYDLNAIEIGGNLYQEGNQVILYKLATNNASAIAVTAEGRSTITANSATGIAVGVRAIGDNSFGNAYNLYQIIGAQGFGEHLGTATITELIGLDGQAQNQNNGTATLAAAHSGIVKNTGGGTLTNVYNYIARAVDNSSGTMTSVAQIAIEAPGAGTNRTNLLIGTSTIPSGTYSIYNSSSAANYFAGSINLANALFLSADISPSQITSNQNDYAPTNFATSAVLRLNSDASRNITGLAGGSDGAIYIVCNVGSFDIVLKDESASSSAANRFAFDGDLTLGADTSATLYYDSTSSRWRLLSVGKTATGGASGITVAEADGSPSYASITTLQFDSADGFTVTNPSAGVAQIDFTASSTPLNSIFNGRLTLTTATSVTTSDVTAATQIYLTPHNGSDVYLYDGSSLWSRYTLSEISIKITDTQNGNNTNGSKIITNLTDTSQFIVGMKVSGTGIAANSTIATIDSATQVTLNNNCTSTNTGTALTFKVAASTALDIFVYNSSGSLKLEMVAWTNSTTRATAVTLQSGVYVKSGSTTKRLVGSVYLTTTDGQTEHSRTRRFVSNVYNRYPFEIRATCPNSDWTVGTSVSQRACNSNTTEGQMRAPFFATLTEVAWSCSMSIGLTATASDQRNLFAIGLNSTSTTYGSSHRTCGALLTITVNGSGFASTVGYNYLQMQESSASGGGMTVNAETSTSASLGLDAIAWL